MLKRPPRTWGRGKFLLSDPPRSSGMPSPAGAAANTYCNVLQNRTRMLSQNSQRSLLQEISGVFAAPRPSTLEEFGAPAPLLRCNGGISPGSEPGRGSGRSSDPSYWRNLAHLATLYGGIRRALSEDPTPERLCSTLYRPPFVQRPRNYEVSPWTALEEFYAPFSRPRRIPPEGASNTSCRRGEFLLKAREIPPVEIGMV